MRGVRIDGRSGHPVRMRVLGDSERGFAIISRSSDDAAGTPRPVSRSGYTLTILRKGDDGKLAARTAMPTLVSDS